MGKNQCTHHRHHSTLHRQNMLNIFMHQTLPHSLFLSHSLTNSLSLSRTHTHTHKQTHSRTHTLTFSKYTPSNFLTFWTPLFKIQTKRLAKRWIITKQNINNMLLLTLKTINRGIKSNFVSNCEQWDIPHCKSDSNKRQIYFLPLVMRQHMDEQGDIGKGPGISYNTLQIFFS